MSKVRTLTQLQDTLDGEMSWRIKEISAFRLASKQDNVSKKAFIRAGVAILYAHWEGFVKASSEAYLNFIGNQSHSYVDLKTCFAVMGLKQQLITLSDSKRTNANVIALDFIFGEMEKPAKLNMSSAIDTGSNLTSKTFSNIAASLNIAVANYETRFNLIDESLVNRRNKVAHGEYLDLDDEDFRKLVDEVLMLMRHYKTDLQNAASVKEYLR